MVMEVGPDRWHRASVNLEDGTAEIVKLSSHFENTYLILRKEGAHAKTCPMSLAKHLKDQNPKDMGAEFCIKFRGMSWSRFWRICRRMVWIVTFGIPIREHTIVVF